MFSWAVLANEFTVVNLSRSTAMIRSSASSGTNFCKVLTPPAVLWLWLELALSLSFCSMNSLVYGSSRVADSSSSTGLLSTIWSTFFSVSFLRTSSTIYAFSFSTIRYFLASTLFLRRSSFTCTFLYTIEPSYVILSSIFSILDAYSLTFS